MKKHLRLLLGFFGLMSICSLALLPDATLAMLSVMLALSINLFLFKFFKPFDNFEIVRNFDKYQVTPPDDVNTTLQIKYNGNFPANASVEFDCKSLGLNVNTGNVVFQPGQNYNIDRTFTADRRGVHKISNTKVIVKDWLLLSGISLKSYDESEILVLPHIYPFGTPPQTSAAGLIGVASAHKQGRSSEVWGIRDYQPGDDFKIISWKAMAKSPDHKPKSKIMAGEEGQAITVIVDVGKDMELPNGNNSNLDIAADIAASLTYNFVKRGTRSGLIFFDTRTRMILKPNRGEAHIDSLLRNLAKVQPSQDRFLITNLTKTYLEFSAAEFGNSFILILGRTEDRLIESYIRKLKSSRDLVVILLYNEDNHKRAMQIKEYTDKHGIDLLLVDHLTIKDTIKKMEEWSYATIRRT